ncbi:FecCD family ABC transporter permease [Microbacterium murale]|uniref:Iron complex transport system permease protein n=1 Tax=Microbacterium murale TaxID=1081040 RepID=A0ABU0P997_9MICO|nr:iron chelate uptake ABC transporter family permease subunit [Microbacterium murale]MDQ0643883.1 iron complex transport system permease protein [Microbacterium murale]
MSVLSPRRPDVVVRAAGTSIRVNRRAIMVAAALLVVITALALWATTLGSFPITVPEVVQVLSGGGDDAARKVVLEWRGPRILAAIVFGCLLGISGAIFQSLTRNPLGSPDIIGFNAGSYTGVIVMLMLGINGYAATVTAAMIGGLAAAAVVYFLAFRQGVSGMRLILVGIAMSAFLGGLNQWFSVKADVDEAMRAAVWGAGSLALADGTSVAFGAIVLALVIVALPVGQRRMRRLELGDDMAAALGVPVERSKVMLVVLGVVTTAVVTATAGPIAFVALAAPQIGRRLRGRGTSVDVVSAALVGAVVLLSADMIAQHAIPQVLLPVGAVTVCIGGLYLLWLLIVEGRRK